MPPIESSSLADDEASQSDSIEDYVKEYFLADDPLFCKLANQDQDLWIKNVKLDVDPDIRHLYDTKTYPGHAESGHCAWEDHRYSNATNEEIVRALGYDSDEIRQESEVWMAAAQEILMSGLDNPTKPFRLIDSDGYLVGGIKEFQGLEIKDPLMFAWGFYLAGAIMDNAEWRQKMSAWFEGEFGFKLRVHTGICVPIDLEKLSYWDAFFDEDLELTLTSLAADDWDVSDVEWFREAGIIPEPEEGEEWVQASRTVISAYIQLTGGKFGGSDDASINYIGRVYGLDAMLGAYIADWFDTMDKHPDKIYDSGRDEHIANMVFNHPAFQKEFGPEGRDWLREEVYFPFLLFGNSVPVEYLELGGKMKRKELKKMKLPSSSQSRFLRLQWVEGRKYMTALSAHLGYAIYGEDPPWSLLIAFERREAKHIYERLDNKFMYFHENDLFAEGHEPRFI